MILDTNILKLYADNGFNVLLSGRHGVGKTEIIKSVFNESFGEGKWAYFSAATMDAWVDFIGTPKAVERDGEMVLELIRPARFAKDDIQALFFDEFNRAPAKVRNAVMELIQFKSINGRPFKNLKVVWGAVNPHDEDSTYDVDRIDPAQLDRFQVQIEVPYKVDRGLLKGRHGPIAVPFVEWWSKLPEKMKFSISPRRLEDAIKVYKVKGDLKHVLPVESNVADLLSRISALSLDDEWREITQMSHDEKLRFFNLESTTRFEDYILKNFNSFAQYVPEDMFVSKLETKNESWLRAAMADESAVPDTVQSVIEKRYNQSFDEAVKSLLGFTKPKGNLSLAGKNVVVTGKFMKSYSNVGVPTRDDVEAMLQNIGAYIQKKVNGNTDYLIAANILNTSSKWTDAQQYVQKGTLVILSEDEFHDSYGNAF